MVSSSAWSGRGSEAVSALLAIVVGIVLFVLFLKLALGIIGLALGLAVAVVTYFVAEKLVGQGR